MLRIATLLTTCGIVLSANAATWADSKTPPAGPPWKRDFLEAHREALRLGKPIFIYFTKTY